MISDYSIFTKGASIYHVVRFFGNFDPPPIVVKHGHLANPPIKPRGHSRAPPPNFARFFEYFYTFLSYLCEGA